MNDELATVTAIDAGQLTAAQRAGLVLISKRTLIAPSVDAFFGLNPGDRSLVKAGEAVGRGQPIVEHFRDPRTLVVAGSVSGDGSGAPGERWAEPPGRRARDGEATPGGELLFRSGGKWRIAGGERPDPIEAPFAGIVHEVRPGTGVTVRTTANAILGEPRSPAPRGGGFTS